MNFNALEGLIKSIVGQYMCESCKGKVETKDISIQNIEGNSVTVEIVCPACSTKAYLKTEVVSIDLTKYLSQEQLVDIKKSFMKSKNQQLITDEEIVALNKSLKQKNITASELFE